MFLVISLQGRQAQVAGEMVLTIGPPDIGSTTLCDVHGYRELFMAVAPERSLMLRMVNQGDADLVKPPGQSRLGVLS